MDHYTVQQVIHRFSQWAPLELSASWDNVGLQIGSPYESFHTIIVSLDVDESVLDYLSHTKHALVITHHPLFFTPLRCLRYDQDVGQIISAFIHGHHHLFSAHTNLDAAIGGVNDCLIDHYGFDPSKGQIIDNGFGKYFDSPDCSFSTLTHQFPCELKGASHTKPVSRLGFCAGSGHGFIHRIIDLNIDTFITGEITYHDHVTCRMNGIRVITLGHKESEQFICQRISDVLSPDFHCPITVL